ncbi:acyl-CoA dehydrogenase family protein [Geomicrobium sediminis]|uniref:Acyl-CoA dehydrogenase n=1 Tax=Geomicrobium sediminis TaxID=1347788 RepID=A0ABS2PC42_9BACL|nr:acyl-CoA dehydrogenase family protein [Geomicrobium sediminis]MBM7632867.1 acyl-CoA dehydrogenase [Geomicrobium sediminis]
MITIERMLIDTTEKLFKQTCTKELINDSENGIFPKIFWNELDSMGITTIGVPEDCDGSGFTKLDAFAVLKIAGSFAAPIPLAESIIANWQYVELGLPLPNTKQTISMINEDVDLQQHSEGWIINGTFNRVPFTQWADELVSPVKTTTGKWYLLTIPLNLTTTAPDSNIAGESRNKVICQNTSINSSQVIAMTPEHAAQFIHETLLGRTMMMAGALQQILTMSIHHAKERQQFGRPIGKFQAIKQQLAVLTGLATSANVIADSAATATVDNIQFQTEVKIAKTYISQSISKAVPIAHQIHAAIGFTHEHPLHQYTRRLWSWRDEYGSEAFWAKQIGENVLSSSKSLWNQL